MSSARIPKYVTPVLQLCPSIIPTMTQVCSNFGQIISAVELCPNCHSATSQLCFNGVPTLSKVCPNSIATIFLLSILLLQTNYCAINITTLS